MDDPRDGAGGGIEERLLRFGLGALVCYALAGLTLEVLHGFKVSWYLHALAGFRRELLVLGHAHGTLLSVVLLVVVALWPRFAAAALRGATVLLPAGFVLGGIAASGGDPGYGILLVPLGALLLVAALLALVPPRPR